MYCNVQRVNISRKIEFKNKVIFTFYNISFDGSWFLKKKIVLQKTKFALKNFYLLSVYFVVVENAKKVRIISIRKHKVTLELLSS